MKLSNQQPIKPSFKAKVIIAPKDTIVKEAGNYCAEQLEKVIPTIKKIAEKEKNIDEILINPVIRKYNFNNSGTEEVTNALNIMVVKYKHKPLNKTIYGDQNFDGSNNIVSSLENLLRVFKNLHNIKVSEAINEPSKTNWFKRVLNKLINNS